MSECVSGSERERKREGGREEREKRERREREEREREEREKRERREREREGRDDGAIRTRRPALLD